MQLQSAANAEDTSCKRIRYLLQTHTIPPALPQTHTIPPATESRKRIRFLLLCRKRIRYLLLFPFALSHILLLSFSHTLAHIHGAQGRECTWRYRVAKTQRMPFIMGCHVRSFYHGFCEIGRLNMSDLESDLSSPPFPMKNNRTK